MEGGSQGREREGHGKGKTTSLKEERKGMTWKEEVKEGKERGMEKGKPHHWKERKGKHRERQGKWKPRKGKQREWRRGYHNTRRRKERKGRQSRGRKKPGKEKERHEKGKNRITGKGKKGR